MRSHLCLVAFITQLSALCFLVWSDHPWWGLAVLLLVEFKPCNCPKKEASK